MTTNTFLWDQNQVGDAGFRSEQSRLLFWKVNGNDPWLYQPIVAKSKSGDAIYDVVVRNLRGRPGFILFDYGSGHGAVHGVTSGGSTYLHDAF